MTKDTGASPVATGLAGASAPEPPSRLGPSDGIPSAVTLPPHIAEQVLRMGKVDWGAVGPKSDAEHVSDFADSLAITREHFALNGPRHLCGLYLAGTDTVLCHTGTSPNSPTNAQALAGVWNWLVEQASAGEAGTATTVQQGVVHEHAVGEAETPSPDRHTPESKQ